MTSSKLSRSLSSSIPQGQRSGILTLAPMIDILTVLLVFLILTFVTDEQAVHLTQGTELPRIDGNLKSLPRLHVEVTREGLSWNGLLLPSNAEALAAKLLEKGFEKNEKLLIVADRSSDFHEVDKAVSLLTRAGYTDFYFLTAQEEN